MKKIRIVLADDHAMLRAGLAVLINGQPDMEVVGEAGDGLTALELARAERPDVAVLDVSMPTMGERTRRSESSRTARRRGYSH